MSEPVHVLVVDDDPAQLLAAARILRADGMDVSEAASGQGALDILRSRPVALLLLDAVLPDMHGTEIVRLLRQDRRFDDMAIVLVSSREVTPDARAAGLDAGADGYIARPVGRREFVSHVRAQLRQGELARRLRASEERFRRLIHSQSDAVVVVDARGFIQLANEAAERLLARGSSPEGSPFPFSLQPGGDADTVRLRPPEGADIVLEIRSAPTEWHDEPAVIASLRDVTSRAVALARLRESEARYREIVDQSRDLIFVNREGRIRFVNPAGVSMLRAPSAEALIGRSPFEIIHPDHHERVKARIAALMSHPGVAPIVDNRMVALDGTIIDVEVMAVSFQSGEHLDIQVICRDVTLRRKAEERERALAQRLASTLESLADGFFTLDEEWRFTFASREAGRLLGQEPTEILGHSYFDVFPANLGTGFERGYRESLSENRLVEFEEHCQSTDAWFNVRANPIPGGLAVTLRDVTGRRLLQAQLEEQAALLDAAREVIYVQDLEGRIRYWNRAAELLHERSAPDALGRTAAEILGTANPVSPEVLSAVLEAGSWKGVHRHRDARGEERHVETSLTLVRDESGAARAVLAICSDITDRKRLEAQLLRAQRMESIGTLAGGIAHDLNNVLTPVLMAVDLLREDLPQEARMEMLASVEGSVLRGARMVKQLLSFARGASEDAAQVDVRLIVKEVMKVARDTFPKSIRLEVEEGRSSWLLVADPTQIHQILMNLSVNARDAMPDGGRLSIRVSEESLDDTFASMHPQSRPGPHLLIEVTDTGAGISPEHLDRIFDPFFTTKLPGQGTGLGLATVHSIVRGLGGFVQVASEIGKGTRFRIHLPAQTAATTSAAAMPSRSTIPRGEGQLILLVDDEPSVRDIARRTLEKHGYRVLLAEHGAEAISRLATNRGQIAAIVTDMSMPVMDGPATIVAVRTLEPDMRIIASSGLATEAMLARAASLGVMHFVAKPYTADALLAELHAILSEPGPVIIQTQLPSA